MDGLLGKLKNLFCTGRISRRNKTTIQGTTKFKRSIEGVEHHPYGFASRSTAGKVLFFFEGGDVRSPVMLYVVDQDKSPDIQDEEVALWANSGACVVLRDSGKIELNGNSEGGLVLAKQLKQQLDKNTAILEAILMTINNSVILEPGSSSPSALQVALKGALAGKQVGDFSHIESQMVFHGNS